jgi:hypothetical protein
MASAICPGKIELVMKSPSGNEVAVAYDTQAFGACSDGSVTNSYEKWPFQPILKQMMNGGELQVRVTLTAAKTTDASDAVWQIPIYNLDSGMTETLSNSSTDFDILALQDIAIVASTPTVVARKRMTGKRWTIGGGRVFLTLQDNA